MLNKKSEYRIQYVKLNDDLRRRIWQDNIALRKSRLLSNQTTHYWEYQLRDDVCDCDNGEDDDDDDGPLPPHRQKPKELRDQYIQQINKSQMPQVSLVQRDAREIAVQTPEWNGDEPDNRLDNMSEDKLVRNMSSLTVPEPKDKHTCPASPTPPKSRPKTAVPRTCSSRTSRRLNTESKRTHFVPFGWNEAKTDVGYKQTYNVCAPEKEVHDSAILASQRRKAEMKLALAQEKNVKHHPRSRERTTSSSNSLWMSEYQEQFSVRGSKSLSRSSRPLSAPPATRQPVSWRHS